MIKDPTAAFSDQASLPPSSPDHEACCRSAAGAARQIHQLLAPADDSRLR